MLAIVAVTSAYARVLGLHNPTVVGLSYLMIVLLVAADSTLRVAAATSVRALFSLNVFFLPPVGSLAVEDPQRVRQEPHAAAAAFLERAHDR